MSVCFLCVDSEKQTAKWLQHKAGRWDNNSWVFWWPLMAPSEYFYHSVSGCDGLGHCKTESRHPAQRSTTSLIWLHLHVITFSIRRREKEYRPLWPRYRQLSFVYTLVVLWFCFWPVSTVHWSLIISIITLYMPFFSRFITQTTFVTWGTCARVFHYALLLV